jgi:hypothetical protein
MRALCPCGEAVLRTTPFCHTVDLAKATEMRRRKECVTLTSFEITIALTRETGYRGIVRVGTSIWPANLRFIGRTWACPP